MNAGSFIRQQIEFDCPICSVSYDDDKRYPMMLCTAQHCCCLSCLEKVIYLAAEESDCPFCKTKIHKKDAKKFRLLQQIKETANKLKAHVASPVAQSSKTIQQLQEQLFKQQEKNVWLIQQMQEREEQWIKKLAEDSHEEERLKTELLMRKFEVEHLRAVLHDQNERLSHQLIKENSLLNENIKMKLHQPHNHHSRPKLTFEDFQIIQKLGKGEYSIIYLAREKRLGFLCVLKAIEKWKVKQLSLEDTVLNELKVASYLEHPNITKVYGCFWDDKFVYTIGEYAVEENLTKYIKKHPHANYAPIVRQITLAVQELATHSIIHNEINCSVFILTFEDVVKLSDFSWASFAKKENNKEAYFKDIRAIALICYQMMHPEKAINDVKSSQLRKEIEEELNKPEGEASMSSFMELALSKSDSPFRLLTDLLAHPYLNEK